MTPTVFTNPRLLLSPRQVEAAAKRLSAVTQTTSAQRRGEVSYGEPGDEDNQVRRALFRVSETGLEELFHRLHGEVLESRVHLKARAPAHRRAPGVPPKTNFFGTRKMGGMLASGDEPGGTARLGHMA